MTQKSKFYLVLFLLLIFICMFSITNNVLGKRFNDFPINNSLFCLNRGWGFSRNLNYMDNPIASGTIGINNGVQWSSGYIPNSATLQLGNLSLTDNMYSLAYILSQSDIPKTSVGASKRQVAVWRILGFERRYTRNKSGSYIGK